MSQSSSELTTRDVLQQVNRRLELIESDQRELNHKVDALDDKFDTRFTAQDAKMENRFSALDDKFDARFSAQDAKMENRFSAQDAKIENRFRWTIGLILMSWMSTMGAIIFRLGPLH